MRIELFLQTLPCKKVFADFSSVQAWRSSDWRTSSSSSGPGSSRSGSGPRRRSRSRPASFGEWRRGEKLRPEVCPEEQAPRLEGPSVCWWWVEHLPLGFQVEGYPEEPRFEWRAASAEQKRFLRQQQRRPQEQPAKWCQGLTQVLLLLLLLSSSLCRCTCSKWTERLECQYRRWWYSLQGLLEIFQSNSLRRSRSRWYWRGRARLCWTRRGGRRCRLL